jgi:hypothetical protein
VSGANKGVIMSHPVNKRERFFIGDNKAKRRFYGETGTWKSPKEWTEKERRTWTKKGIARRRKTTKLCSCSMCGNPRRKSWKDKFTMQEKKFFESLGL